MTQSSEVPLSSNQPTLPLVIGVTGHRDLVTEDIPDLKKRLRSIFSDLKKEYSNTSLLLMSALADGADRLAADVALEMGLELFVPLPMPQELYKEDFSETSAIQFQNYLDKADISVTLPMEPGNSADTVRAGGVARDRQYHAVGRFIVAHSLILIAIWDGATGGPMGGTSQVVRMQLEGMDDNTSSDDDDLFAPLQTGPVIHIMTRRSESNSTPDDAYLSHYRSRLKNMEGVNFLYPRNGDDSASREEEENRTVACIERFNRDTSDIFRIAPDFDAARQQSAEYVLKKSSDGSQDSFSQKDLSPPSSQLLVYFAHSDALAQQFQQSTYKVLLLIPCLIPLIVLFLGLYSNNVAPNMLSLTGYFATICMAYGIYIYSQRKSINEKFLDYRALAEGMRVALFWRLAGIKEVPASFYLSNQQSELDWIRYAIRTWCLLSQKGIEEKATSQSKMAVKRYWLKDQMDYFGKKARTHNQTADKLNSMSKIFFRLGLFIMTPAMLAIHGLKLGGDALDAWTMVFTPLFFVVAGSIDFYSYRMLFAEHAKQYARMYGMFKKSLDLLSKSDDEARQRLIILAIGKEALAENGDWVLLHRARPIEVPQG